jgi:hypothetical protein
LVVDTSAVLNVVNAQVPKWHQILVIVNSSVWGGAGGTIGTTSTAPGWENVGIHELGHTVFGLADEYEYWAGCGIDTDRDKYSGAEPSAPNITKESNRNTIKWNDLVLATTPMPTTSNKDCSKCDPQPSPVNPGTVGAFEGAGYYHCGLYRPEFHCMMRNLSAFCAVCQRQIRWTMLPYMIECFIASAAYQSPLAPRVQYLREVRERRLRKSNVGNTMVEIFEKGYYSFSPLAAELIARHEGLRAMTRWFVVAPATQLLMIAVSVHRGMTWMKERIRI